MLSLNLDFRYIMYLLVQTRGKAGRSLQGQATLINSLTIRLKEVADSAFSVFRRDRRTGCEAVAIPLRSLSS
jgi:hypothetical protein